MNPGSKSSGMRTREEEKTSEDEPENRHAPCFREVFLRSFYHASKKRRQSYGELHRKT